MGAPALEKQADRVPNDDSAPSFDQSEVSGPCVAEIVVRKTLVVVCPERSRTLFKRMWQKAIDADIVLIDYAGQNEADLAAEAVAREDVPECFVLVPPFVCPTSPLVSADLEIVKAKVTSEGLSYRTMLPVALDKTKIVETFEAMKTSGETDFLAEYHRLTTPGVIPLEVSNAGRFVGYVMRASPDLGQVDKALAERKFISCSEAGFAAVEKLLVKRYAE